MHQRSHPRYLTSRRAHRETMLAMEEQTLLLRRILRKVGKIMTSNENLAAAVARVEGVGPSVIKALGELAKEIANLQNNTEAQAMADRLNAQADAIAAAVEANPDPNPND